MVYAFFLNKEIIKHSLFASIWKNIAQNLSSSTNRKRKREKNLNLTELLNPTNNLIKVVQNKIQWYHQMPWNQGMQSVNKWLGFLNKLGGGRIEKEKTNNRLKEIPITQCMHLLRIRFKNGILYYDRDFSGGPVVKNLPMPGTQVQSLVWEDFTCLSNYACVP